MCVSLSALLGGFLGNFDPLAITYYNKKISQIRICKVDIQNKQKTWSITILLNFIYTTCKTLFHLFFENLFPISDKADQKHLQQLISLDQKEIIIRSANETSLRVELYNKHFKSWY